jgi:hypothetical protein
MLEDNLKELETWRRDLRHQIGDLICDDAHDAPLRLLGVASTISYIEVAIRAVQGAQNAMQECGELIERIESDREVEA